MGGQEQLTQEESNRVGAAMRLEQAQVLAEIRFVIAQLPERQKWQTEVVADIIRTLVSANKAEGRLALALVGAEQVARG